MKTTLKAELARLKGLPFSKVVNRRKLVQGFHDLAVDARAQGHPDFGVLKAIYEWVFVPLSVWPVDIEGLMVALMQSIKAGTELDERLRLKCRLLKQMSPPEGWQEIWNYERSVRTGNYDMLIEAQHKFDEIEHELRENRELKADWDAIRAQFDVDKFRNKVGVIRRRPVQERNFHGSDWKFGWATEAEQFQNVFDAFCHKWDLYGVQRPPNRGSESEPRNTPNTRNGSGEETTDGADNTDYTDAEDQEQFLLLKLTVNITPYGTLIMVPRYWSVDSRRDLKWNEITKLHRLRSAGKQGRKMSENKDERRREAQRAQELSREARAAGLKGDKRVQWVMGRLGWDARNDESRLKRLLRKR